MIIGLFNGPPRCGKDTAVEALIRHFNGQAVEMKISEHLKNATHAAYGIYGVPHDHFEKVKDTPLAEFLGLTPRDAYIAHSEQYMKPLHGKAVFGRIMAQRIRRETPEIVFISDSGFSEEAFPLMEIAGPENVFLMRIHMEGKDFSNDSRDYVYLDDVRSIDVENVFGKLDEFRELVLETTQSFIADIYAKTGIPVAA